MLHLRGLAGQPALVADGLSVPREVWQIGDIIVQRHTFDLPPDTPIGQYQPLIGIYWLDTMEHWVITAGPHAGNDHIPLPAVTIE